MVHINHELHTSLRSTVTTREAADLLHLKESTVRAYARVGLVRSIRIGRGNVIDLASVDRLKRVGTPAARAQLHWRSGDRGRAGQDLEGSTSLLARRATELAHAAKRRLAEAREQDLADLDVEVEQEALRKANEETQLERRMSDMHRMRIQARLGAELVHTAVSQMTDEQVFRLADLLGKALGQVTALPVSSDPTPNPLMPIDHSSHASILG